jgi:hypothetical protein
MRFDINKYFNITIGNTNNINISLNNLFGFNSITNYFKLHIFFSKNEMILDITESRLLLIEVTIGK